MGFYSGFALGAASAVALSVWFYQSQVVKKKKGNVVSAISRTPIDSSSFFTSLIAQLWPYIRSVAEESIRSSLVDMLTAMSLELKSMSLGSTPLRMDNMVVVDSKHIKHQRKDKDDYVQFYFDLIWEASDVDIKISSYLGSFGVSSILLQGRLSVLLKPLVANSSIVSAVQIAFINTPDLSLQFSGLAAVAELNVMETQIRSVLADSLNSMVVLPIRMGVKLDNSASLLRGMYEPPVGIVRVTVMKGRGFQVEQLGLGVVDIPDVYVLVKVGTAPAYRTSTIEDSLEPVWGQGEAACADFLVSDTNQMVSLTAMDEDRGPLDPDDHLGDAAVSVAELLLAGGAQEVELRIDGENTGAFLTVHASLSPLVDPKTIATAKAPSEACSIGLMTAIVTHGSKLPIADKSTGNSVFVEIRNIGPKILTTATVADGSDPANPVFDAIFEVPIHAIDDPVEVVLKNNATILASAIVKIETLVEQGKVEQRLKTGDDGYIEFGIILSGLQPATAPVATNATKKPNLRGSKALATIKTVRITLVRGYGFQVQKGFMKNDIPDVFCRISFNGKKDWKTPTVADCCEPEFNESREFLMPADSGHLVVVDAFDQDKKEAQPLGRARISIGDLLMSNGPLECEIERRGDGTAAFVLLEAKLV